jgi:hypothetical protein
MQPVVEGTRIEGGDLLEGSHKRMLTIADIANVLSWIVMIGCIGMVVVSVIGEVNYLNSERGFQQLVGVPGLGNYVIHEFMYLCQGLVYALVLKGVSLGLKMLVETNVNYKLGKEEGESHE